jgi:uncharacterized phage-associated protein
MEGGYIGPNPYDAQNDIANGPKYALQCSSMLRFKFNSRRSTQAACHLLKLRGGTMTKAMLIKLLYLADRNALQKWGQSLTGDIPYSMEHGPVLSTIYDLTKGSALPHRDYWARFISDADPDTNEIHLKATAECDHLSKSDIEILNAVFEQFKDFSWRKMREYCHALPEWEDPGSSSKSIDFEEILRSVGKGENEILEIQNTHREEAWLDAVLGS